MDNILPEQELGPYRLLNQVGQGGMATVYRAYHAAMDRYVAIKVLPRRLAESPEFTGRFRQEAHTIARLEHAHILPVHDYGEAAGYTYLVMRYLDTGTLTDRLEKSALPLPEVDRLFSQLAAALQYAHAQGVVHRDLKPSNVLLDASGNVFLTDFGIAKLLAGDARFTNTGAFLGTPAYISPEQAQGLPVDQRSDIYSLGVILYEMVTGRVPFEAETPLAVILKHVHEPLPRPTSVKADLPPSIETVLLKALAKEPAHRYASSADFAADWKVALRGLPGIDSTVGMPAPAAKPLPTTVIGPAPSAPRIPPAPPQSAAPPSPVARRGFGWAALLAGLVALGLLLCGGVVCGSWLFAQMFSQGRDGTPVGAVITPGGEETPLDVPTLEGMVQLPLTEGLPRSLTYAGLDYTVTEAVMDNVIDDGGAGSFSSDTLFARVTLMVRNTTTNDAYPDPNLFKLRLANGTEYACEYVFDGAPAPGSAKHLVVVFEVPASGQWDDAVLVFSQVGKEPAELPLTGEVPPAEFPKEVSLPAETEFAAPDAILVYTLLGATLDLDLGVNRVDVGRRVLVLNVRITNLGRPQGEAIGPTNFRLIVDGVPLAPEEAPIEVVDKDSAIEDLVIFIVPAGAASVDLQFGNVSAEDTEFVTVTLNLSGE